MKKKVLLPAWLFIIISMLSFTSCEEDSVISDTLSGTWKGYMSVDYRYNGRVYPSSYSIIDFMKDPYTYSSGRGYWIDYYSNAPSTTSPITSNGVFTKASSRYISSRTT